MISEFKHVNRILISRLRFMGDVILTTPLIRILRENFPLAHLAYLAEKPYSDLLQNNPHLNQIIPIDRATNSARNSMKRLQEQIRLFKFLRAQRFDLAIDLLGNPRSALLIWATGARYRVGGDFRGRRHLYNIRVRPDGQGKSAIEFHLESLRVLGIPIQLNSYKTEIFTTVDEDEWATNYLLSQKLDLNRPLVGIHPGATWPAKMWPWEKFAALAERIIEELNMRVFLTHGPGEEALVAKIRTRVPQAVSSTKPLNLRQLAALLKKFDLYITNDCGPMHLAVAVGTRTIGIFGPGEPDIWFPYKNEDGHYAIVPELPCRPCHQDFCSTMKCMEMIKVEHVLAVTRKSL